jgi:transcriptional antiterminator NusG
MNESPEDVTPPEAVPEEETSEAPEASEPLEPETPEVSEALEPEEAAEEIVEAAAEAADAVAAEVFVTAVEEGLEEAAADGVVTEEETEQVVEEAATMAEAAREQVFEGVIEDVVEEAVAEAAAEEIEAAAEEVADEVAAGVFAVALEEGLEEAAADGEVTEAEAKEAFDAAAALAQEAGEEAFEATIEVAEAVLEEAVEEEEAPAAEAEAPAAVEPEAEAEIETVVKDPFKGLGDWYVVHTYAGYENKVKTNLESRIHTMQMEDKIFDVHIPMEDVMEIKGGKKQVVQRKVFPGYLLVKMIYDNDSWYVVRNTPGVTGFVAAGTGSKPTPLSRREVEKILAVKKDKEIKPTFRLGFEEGDVVRIISGPFADFNGTISEINIDQSKLKVLVNIFDRETPVELGFDQVAKV